MNDIFGGPETVCTRELLRRAGAGAPGALALLMEIHKETGRSESDGTPLPVVGCLLHECAYERVVDVCEDPSGKEVACSPEDDYGTCRQGTEPVALPYTQTYIHDELPGDTSSPGALAC